MNRSNSIAGFRFPRSPSPPPRAPLTSPIRGMYERMTEWQTTKLAAQVRDECGNNLVFDLRKMPRFKANKQAKPQLKQEIRGGTLLTSPVYYHWEDPVRAMFDRLSVTSGFETSEASYMYKRFMKLVGSSEGCSTRRPETRWTCKAAA